MTTRRLEITSRQKEHPIHMVCAEHFTCVEREPIDPLEVLRNPDFSTYCFDPQNEAVLFVEAPEDVRIIDAPFYYMAQFEHAIGLVSMPMQTFFELAEQIEMPSGGLVLIHSVGRCGSTLLSKALAAIPCLESLSEPDDISQINGFRSDGVVDDAWVKKAVNASIRWRCKPRHGSPAQHVAIKTRSEVITIADEICAAFPGAKHLFMYRDGISWAESIYALANPDRDFADVEQNRTMQATWASFMPAVAENQRDDPPLNPIEIRILVWATCMETYLRLRDSGVPLCALRYEDLTQSPRQILEKIFAFCGITVDDWDAVSATFERDSQEGTAYAREAGRKEKRALPNWLRQSAVDMIATRPQLNIPGVLLPGTVRISPSR